MTTEENSSKSKKRSDAKSSSKPLDSFEIFIDRSLGKKIAEPLKAAGAIVHLHDDYFEQNVEDQDWLFEVGQRGWIVLTKDKWIRRRPIEREALLNANLKVFCFMSGSISFSEMAVIFANALPAIQETAEKKLPPFIAGIYRDATVKIILTRS
jgi:predicted nuclease of predicted toxin-antitoxin system